MHSLLSGVIAMIDLFGYPKNFRESIFVVIPMFRVADQIQAVIRGIPDWVDGIVVVDDASPDQSAGSALSTRDPRITLVSHSRNLGVGGAMLSGYIKAVELGATIMVKMDGDNQMPPEHLPALIRPIIEGHADYAKGNRFLHSDALRKMPLLRRVGNLFLSFMIKAASGYWNIFDPTNGYTAIDQDVFRQLNLNRIHRRYFFESSMLMELNSIRALVVDVPIPACYLDETSSLSIRRALREFPPLLISGYLRRIWNQYYVLDFTVASLFSILGTLMMIFGAVWGLWNWQVSHITGVPSTTGTVMVAVLPFILGFNMLMNAITIDLQNIPRKAISSHTLIRARRVFFPVDQ